MTAARRGRKRESLLPREETRRSPAEEAGQAARSGEQKEAMLSRQYEALLAPYHLWLETQRNLSAATVRAYLTDIRQFMSFLAEQGRTPERLDRIDRRDVQSFLAELFRRGEARSSMSRKLAALRSFFQYALRIKSVAEENDVPIVENPPLARALFASTELDQTIPTEHFKAVAEVINYVMQLKNQQ